MRILLSLFITIAALPLFAQRNCASHDYVVQQTTANPAYANAIHLTDNFISRLNAAAYTASARTATNIIIKIPVVVHVVYNNAAQNISDEQVNSQIEALNRDFRRRNADSVNTPDRFVNIAADAEIEFVLATADPAGRPSTGIVRKYSATAFWQSDDKIKFSKQGGDDAWDSKSYLNIWVGGMRSLLGYSSAPGGPAEKDGVVINPTAFGTIHTAAPYHMGRTAVHEIGHWLGLRHIWGDDACGDDYVDDTPKQGSFTSGCPSGFRSSCSNGTAGDMYMNYMDFTNDACMNLFTEGQKARMRALFANGGPRAALLQSKGLNKPWTAALALPEAVSLPEQKVVSDPAVAYPNPTAGEVTLHTGSDTFWIGSTLTVVSVSGVVVKTITITMADQKVDISNLPSGIYLLQAVNGGQKIRVKVARL